MHVHSGFRPGPVIAACLIVMMAMQWPARAGADSLTVFAAASLKNALDDVIADFRAESGLVVRVSYAGSSLLARQIQAGAPANLFISANVDWMDLLERDGLVVSASRINLLGNRLVLVAHGPDRPEIPMRPGIRPDDILAGGRLAMGLVDSIPAGLYGRQALQALGVWNQVVPHVVQTDNVRAALALVSAGEASVGIVYATDARAEPDVVIIGAFPADTHDPIIYPAAIVTDRNTALSRRLLDYLRRPAASRIFASWGFPVPGN